jgi:hypothetical protein
MQCRLEFTGRFSYAVADEAAPVSASCRIDTAKRDRHKDMVLEQSVYLPGLQLMLRNYSGVRNQESVTMLWKKIICSGRKLIT